MTATILLIAYAIGALYVGARVTRIMIEASVRRIAYRWTLAVLTAALITALWPIAMPIIVGWDHGE